MIKFWYLRVSYRWKLETILGGAHVGDTSPLCKRITHLTKTIWSNFIRHHVWLSIRPPCLVYWLLVRRVLILVDLPNLHLFIFILTVLPYLFQHWDEPRLTHQPWNPLLLCPVRLAPVPTAEINKTALGWELFLALTFPLLLYLKKLVEHISLEKEEW